MDDHRNQYPERPRVRLCLGTRSCRRHLVRKIAGPLSFFSNRDFAQSASHRAPTIIDSQRTTVTISPMWFSTGKPHPLASETKLEISVTGAAAHNLSDTEVIGDYILYWVGAPMYSRTHEGSLCSIYLIAWKEGWVSEVRLCPTPSSPP